VSSQGAEVQEASGGLEALAEAERARAEGRPYRVVLLDCRMPEMDGFEVAHQLKRQAGGAPPIILMLSSEDLRQTLATVREIGIDLYIVKPVRRAELLRAIALAMGRQPVEVKAALAPSSNGATGDAVRPLKILLVEDSPDNRQLVEAYLRKLPYEVDTAENGLVAVAKFVKGKYDVVLMDMQMPVMDGYTAVRKIRDWESKSGRAPTPIAALTASALEEDVRNSVAAGCTAHLSKPIKKSRLLAALRELSAAPNEAPIDEESTATIVEIDPELAELIPGFLARKREDSYALTTALEHGDYQALRSIGHKIKGEGGGFGLDAISEIGRALEEAAGARDIQAAARGVRALADYLDHVQVTIADSNQIAPSKPGSI